MRTLRCLASSSEVEVAKFVEKEDIVSFLVDTIARNVSQDDENDRDIATGEATCRPRIDIRIPTSDPARRYQFGSMEGGSTAGYFAVRMKSDILYQTEYKGVKTQEKFCKEPGLYCGLIFLTAIENGEPLAFINDGVLQHMRVGGDGGIDVKYMARENHCSVGSSHGDLRMDDGDDDDDAVLECGVDKKRPRDATVNIRRTICAGSRRRELRLVAVHNDASGNSS